MLTSGKMVLLDKLMRKLKETGHRVLVFSQVCGRGREGAGWVGQRLYRRVATELRGCVEAEAFCQS